MTEAVSGPPFVATSPVSIAAGPSAESESRLPLADAIKAIAAQCIVLHHIAAYGPISAVTRPHLAGATEFIYDYGRAAVFVFLVLGGYLAASSLMPAPGRCSSRRREASTLRLVLRRWIRLAWPYWFALFAATAIAVFARRVFDDDDTPLAPGLFEILANGLMLQDILGVAALSAGVWYVAIDLQLYALFAAFAGGWRFRSQPSGEKPVGRQVGDPVAAFAAIGLVCAATIAGWFVFGQDDELEAWAIYFFGAYGIGILARWGSGVSSSNQSRWRVLIIGLCIGAILVDPRIRTVVTALTAIVLLIGWAPGWMRNRVFEVGARLSYSVFLIHYPVCLLVNALIHRAWADNLTANLFGIAFAWFSSNLAGWLLYQFVESRTPRIAG